MTAKSKYEKDSCWGAGTYVTHLRSRDCTETHLCKACGAVAVTAGRVQYTDSRSPDGRPYGDIAFLCRTCHPAHERDVYQVTDVPGFSVVQTYCTTTGNVLGSLVPTADLPEWTAAGIHYLPADLPPIDQMPPRWVELASREYGYLWRRPEAVTP